MCCEVRFDLSVPFIDDPETIVIYLTSPQRPLHDWRGGDIAKRVHSFENSI